MRTLRIPENIGDFLEYDETSPSGLRWKETRTGHIKKGAPVGSQSNGRRGRKVWSTKVNNKNYLCCRLIWFLVHGEDIPVGKIIDHKDGNALNNLVGNLRAVSQAVNTRNTKLAANNTTGVAGVSYRPARPGIQAYYAASANINGKQVSRSFSVLKYGKREAKNLAVSWRQQKLLELNAQGAGYSVRHLQTSGVQL